MTADRKPADDAREVLLPCPFCGGPAMLKRTGVFCTRCEASSTGVFGQEREERWNRRASARPESAEPEVREAVAWQGRVIGGPDQRWCNPFTSLALFHDLRSDKRWELRALAVLDEREAHRDAGRYLHRKSGEHYRLIATGSLEADRSPVAVYVSERSGDTWVRPLAEFRDKFDVAAPQPEKKG